VTDPRLSVLCRDRAGRVVATAWINPTDAARQLSVDGERYPVAAGLPVRVATRMHVDYDHARAIFDVTERDGRGRVLAHRRVVAHVAG
jgi:hypothetical protein